MERKNFCTTVSTSSGGFFLQASDCSMVLGSCFSEYIGGRLADNHFRITVNPFGVLYNPASIFSSLRFLLFHPYPLSETDLQMFFDGNLWRSWLFDSNYIDSDKSQVLSNLNKAFFEAKECLNHLDVLFLTLGTPRAYYLKSSNMVVANCHKQPSSLFEERTLSVSEIVSEGQDTLDALFALRPKLRVVFTVSPFRYAKYGYHESQIGKAILLLAVDQLISQNRERTYYFPAYEIMNDELRDYRFYADDMLHPSSKAVDYIWQIFLTEWVSEESQTFVADLNNVKRALNHRPFNPNTSAYRDFLNKLLQKIDALHKKYPNFALTTESDEVKQCIQALKKQL